MDPTGLPRGLVIGGFELVAVGQREYLVLLRAEYRDAFTPKMKYLWIMLLSLFGGGTCSKLRGVYVVKGGVRLVVPLIN